MRFKEGLYIATLIATYLLVLFLTKPIVFNYKFSENLITRYYLSQDIPHEVNGVRQFLSDSEIHTAAGYLYATGSDPIDYNFQHAPFIKYLYGFSIRLFNTPYPAQVVMGILLLVTTYIFGKKIFKKPEVALLGCIFLVIDPLFLDVSSQLLLDLGQSLLLILYLLLIIYERKSTIAHGIVLGLLLASKFWGGAVFFILVFHAFIFFRKKVEIKKYVAHLVVAVIVFCLVYIASFILRNGFFNIVFFELKTIKYWLHHSVSSQFGSSLILFTSGYLTSWWGEKTLTRSEIWSFLWPTTLVVSIFSAVHLLNRKKFDEQFLVLVLPFMYLIYLGVQAPFTRYFILILPFLYLGFSYFLFSQFNWLKKRFH